ncbi:LysE family translocator [Rhizobium sp. SG2393]|uniref:LysE family translocator n=1 Tax=Rhizobium sp. SG2393 TaxID=3276279 RepID=UPI00366C5109
MSITTLLAYSLALFIAAAIPGPGMTAIVARALGTGFRETFFMGLGLILGDLVYLTAAVLGLAVIAETFAGVFLAIKIIGALYLAYVGWKLWTAGILPQEVAARAPSSPAAAFLSGLLVTLGNPKTMLFYLALTPTLIDIAHVTAVDYAILIIATALVLLAVLLPYILLASRARLLLARPQALKILNRTAGSILAGTAAYMIAKAA